MSGSIAVARAANSDEPRSIGASDDDAVERWRRAAQEALRQLDWAIGYLDRIGRRRAARVLAANRDTIRARTPGRPARRGSGEHE